LEFLGEVERGCDGLVVGGTGEDGAFVEVGLEAGG